MSILLIEEEALEEFCFQFNLEVQGDGVGIKEIGVEIKEVGEETKEVGVEIREAGEIKVDGVETKGTGEVIKEVGAVTKADGEEIKEIGVEIKVVGVEIRPGETNKEAGVGIIKAVGDLIREAIKEDGAITKVGEIKTDGEFLINSCQYNLAFKLIIK